ncbi:MAG: PVC-type heme-binding CxxCH protein [Tunicatimonas sp.]|uniref:PVC-type heme-binding CxxCH protein n=1 Tax=Tunicatimonas sp. TaxID=1940096 RepID=UPI003C7332D4
MKTLNLFIVWLAIVLATVSCQPTSPLSEKAQQAVSTLQVADGFTVELIASEPLIADPVAMEIDEYGRMYVVEMHGYPLDTEGSGKIKLLTDTDKDGLPDQSTTFAEGLILPTGIMRWKQGVLVTDAPDVLYLADTTGDNVADVREVVLTGFARSNPQHNLNSPVYGLDNWIYLAHEGTVSTKFFHEQFGGEGQKVTFPNHPEVNLPVNADGRNVRFRPDTYALEMMSGESQFGHTFDHWGHQIMTSNANHLFHEVLAARYMQRNPVLAVADATEYLPTYGPGAEVFPITQNPEHQLLTDVGTITSSCGVTWYLGDLFPEKYQQVTFIAEPVHNLVHADVIEPKGATFEANRLFSEEEFLASTDSWFRPVNFYVGPDGALYVVDYYRQIVEHPEWMSEEVNQSGALYNGTNQGRIYRISPKNKNPDKFLNNLAIGDLPSKELVGLLEHPNLWQRRTAQRLLVDRQAIEIANQLEAIISNSTSAVGRLHALWTLDGLDALNEAIIKTALQDAEAGVRENTIKLAELHWNQYPNLKNEILALQNDSDAKVRFQLLCSLGSLDNPEAQLASQQLLEQDITDEWVHYAALSSPQGNQHWLAFAQTHFAANQGDAETSFLLKLGALIGLKGNQNEIAEVIQSVEQENSAGYASLLEGLSQGIKYADIAPSALQAEKKTMLANVRPDCDLNLRQASLNLLASLGQLPPKEAQVAVQRAQQALNSSSASSEWQHDALTFLGIADPDRYQNQFLAMLTPQHASSVQNEALRMLRRTAGTAPCQNLLTRWPSLTPDVRENAVNVFLTGSERTHLLLAAVQENQIDQSTVGWRRTVHLMNHDDDSIRSAARLIFSGQTTDEDNLNQYQSYLTSSGDSENGKNVFQQSCATCHQMKGELGTSFGPDLSTVRNRSKESILYDILLPNRSIADGFELWEVTLTNGTKQTGVITSESSTTLTLADLAGNESTVARNTIAQLEAAAYSAMPEGLANQIDEEDMNDLLTFLKQI